MLYQKISYQRVLTYIDGYSYDNEVVLGNSDLLLYMSNQQTDVLHNMFMDQTGGFL